MINITSNMNKGYTLAEALITLAILGALAAISMPMLHNVLPDKYDAMYKKASYAIEHTTSAIVNDDYLYAPEKTFTANCVKDDDGNCEVSSSSTSCCIEDNHCASEMPSSCSSYGIPDGTYKTDVVTGVQNTYAVNVDGVTYEGNTKFCKLFARKFNLFPNTGINCKIFRDVGFYNDGKTPTFVSNDGIQWIVPVSDFTYSQPIAFKVAIKGDSNAPNCAYIPSNFVSDNTTAISRLGTSGSGWAKEKSNRRSATNTFYTTNKNNCRHPDTFLYIITPEGKLIKPEKLTDNIRSANN